MTNDELKHAAELAGMEYNPEREEWLYQGYGYEVYDPALPSYIASLLVAKADVVNLDVKKHPDNQDDPAGWYPAGWYCEADNGDFSLGGSEIKEGPFVAIIRAGVAALEQSK